MISKLISALLLISVSISSYGQNSRNIENVGLGILVIVETANNGDVWVGSRDKGVGFYNASLDNFTLSGRQYGTAAFKNDSITSISFGLIGGVQHAFIGTKDGVIYNKAGTWDSLVGLPDRHISGVALIGSDTLWVTSPSGLVAVDTGTKSYHTHLQSGQYTRYSPRTLCVNYAQRQNNATGC